ncbi:MAG: bacillithiol biosynthesis deacetylase BshB1 [Ignavibacteria bacterium]|jgi:bacillithiol biosynthesis deacetylase BshB1
MNLDVLIFAAHPDDVELAMGGTVAELTKNNLKVGIIDLTKGEMGSRGTVEIRQAEASKASEILNLTHRENLGLPDGKLKLNDEFTKHVVTRIRLHKPKVVFGPYINDRHPDHIGASQIVKEAMFFSGNYKYETLWNGEKQKAYRPGKLFYYMQTFEFDPSFIVDISDSFETKMQAVKAYASQFYNPESNEPETFISRKIFIEYLEARAKFFGFQIRKDSGEPFFTEEQVELDIINLFK